MTETRDYDHLGRITDTRLYESGNTPLLKSVEKDMSYDLNGNMISDGRNNLELTYNIHNLLSTITDSNGDLLNKYTYLSGGSKLKAENSNGEGLIYRGSFAQLHNNRYRFNGKEEQFNFGSSHQYIDYSARMYDSSIARWFNPDPLAEKYFSMSPYVFSANNPVNYFDPDGRKVRPAGDTELTMIKNTLPKEAHNYIKLDKRGYIDTGLLNSHESDSYNLNSLKILANASVTIDVIRDDKFTYMKPNGQLGIATMSYFPRDEAFVDATGDKYGGLSSGESGFMGKVLFPDKGGKQNSPNGNIIVIVNKNLSQAGAAEIYGHEANAHTILYIQTGGNRNAASHHFIKNQGDANIELVKRTIQSKKETIKNMKE